MTDDIKSKLKEFRERKLKEQNVQQRFVKELSPTISTNSPSTNSRIQPSSDNLDENGTGNNENDNVPQQTFAEKLQYFLIRLLIWLSIYMVALKFEFGIVYIIASAFYLLWKSLSTKKRKNPNELSAYSVFNPNCERLLGQTTAEQFENEILRRQPM